MFRLFITIVYDVDELEDVATLEAAQKTATLAFGNSWGVKRAPVFKARAEVLEATPTVPVDPRLS